MSLHLEGSIVFKEMPPRHREVDSTEYLGTLRGPGGVEEDRMGLDFATLLN